MRKASRISVDLGAKWLAPLSLAAGLLGCAERHELLIDRREPDLAVNDRIEDYLIDCGDGPQTPPTELQGTTAAGHIPAGLPQRLGIGLQENQGGVWMRSSDVAWDYRWMYFAPTTPGKDWYNRWGYGAADGKFAMTYFTECDSQGFVPVVQYFNLDADYEPSGDTSQLLAKVQNASYMNDYFLKFKAMLEQAKSFGKPVILIIEVSVFAYLQQQSHSNSNTPAAIAASGIAELVSLPDTVAGFGLAFLTLREAVGARNVVLALDTPYFATGDFISTNLDDDIQLHVDNQFAFLSALGLGANITGRTFDFVATNSLGADFDWYRLNTSANGGESRNLWWDPREAAPINSRSFNRYAEWLARFNRTSNLRWVLWQMPMGNSNSPNRNNPATSGGEASTSAAGWKDNRAEYFFCSESNRHLGQFADAGVVALLFGAAATGCTDQTSDYYIDGQPFLKSHAGALLRAGGFPLAR